MWSMQEITQFSEVKCSHNGLEWVRRRRKHGATPTTMVPRAVPHLQAVFPVPHALLSQGASTHKPYGVYQPDLPFNGQIMKHLEC